MKKPQPVRYNVVTWKISGEPDFVELVATGDQYNTHMNQSYTDLFALYPKAVVMHNAAKAEPEDIQRLS